MTDVHQIIADKINEDGKTFADKALAFGLGSPDVAIAILGVAVGLVIDGIDEALRAEMMQRFLDSFETLPGHPASDNQA